MAYRFKPNQSIDKAVTRLVHKQVDGAIAAIRSSASFAERVHDARTSIKKLRGLLRLVGPGLGRRFRKEDARLRRVGRWLADLRDAEAAVSTFDDLFEAFDHQLNPRLRRARATLRSRMRTRERRLDARRRLRRAERDLRAVRADAKKWRPKKQGWAAVADGLEQTYDTARTAMRAAYRSGDAAVFHEWRKSVKYHGHHVRLLASAWPEHMGVLQDTLDRLGEYLGSDHDLTMFEQLIRTEQDCFPDPADREILIGLIVVHRKALRAAAEPLGTRLFAEPVSAMSRRMRSYFRAARRQSRAERNGANLLVAGHPSSASS